MESKWRFNVWDLGWGGGTYDKIARSNLPFYGPCYITGPKDNRALFQVLHDVPETNYPQFWFHHAVLDEDHLNFPYGYDSVTEPD